MEIYLEVPSLKREKDAMEYIIEFWEHGSVINGTGALDEHFNKYQEWLDSLEKEANKETVPEGKVVVSTYFVVRSDDNKIIGMLNIRHYLSERLISSGAGHIGYSVRPTERQKGYATKILELAVEKCTLLNIEEIHLGCNEYNIGSYKTIEKNNGVLYRSFIDEENVPSREYIIYNKLD